MAKELVVGIAIGAALQGSFMAVFGNAKRTLDTLGHAADKLKQQHQRMGDAMQRAMGKLSGGTLAAINRDYEKLGRTLDALRQKQEALAASVARGASLKRARDEHWAGMRESAAGAVAVGAPFLASVKQASRFEAGLRDIAITGNLKGQEEIVLGETLRRAALSTNQGHEAIIRGVNTLVAQGMGATEAGQYAALLGKSATATGAELDDLAKMMYSLSNNLGIKGEANLKEAINRAAYGAKLGQFELKAMSQYLPTLASTFAAKGIKGQEALTQIIASLEVGRGASGTDGEAVTNLVNWMSHMNTDHTNKAYQKAGVNYQKSMQNLVAKGYSSYEASLQIADKFITGKGDAFMAEWQKAGKAGDENAQRQLMESFGLNEVFTDIQTINHLLAMRQNWEQYEKNKKDMGSKQALGTIDEDYIRRVQTMQKAWERFTTQVTDVAITIGSVFLPALVVALDALGPFVRGFGQWAQANPGLLRGIVSVVGGLLAMRTGIFALRLMRNFLFLAPANSVATAWHVLTSRLTIFRALLLGTSSRFSLLLQFFGMGAGRAVVLAAALGKLSGLALGIGKAMGGGIATAARFALQFGKGLAMTLIGPIKMAGQALLWLGRAMLMNPIGLAITAVGVAAYLVWKHWGTIKVALVAAWAWLKGLKSQFFSAGSELINGLVAGISAKLTAARETVVALGSSIKDWFKSALGINSPSRVFMGYGDNIAQGTAIGIQRSAPMATSAVSGMAGAAAAGVRATSPALQAPALQVQPQRLQAARTGGRPGAGQPEPGTGMVIHFSPQITLPAGSPEATKGAAMDAMQLSLAELERLIRRISADQARRAN